MLQNVVCERILDEEPRVLCDFSSQSLPLSMIGYIDELLHDAASVHVSSDFCTVSDHGIQQKVQVTHMPSIHQSLKHMVAMDLVS